jgi:hypothetical protein
MYTHQPAANYCRSFHCIAIQASLSGKKRIPSLYATIKYKKVDAGKLLRNGKLYATLGLSRKRSKNMPKDPHLLGNHWIGKALHANFCHRAKEIPESAN